MEAKEQRPRCGDCSHLREKAVSDVCSVLWCDIPNGNRKASRDVGGCDEFEPSAACKAEQLREAGKMSADDILKAAGRLGEEIKKMDYAVEG